MKASWFGGAESAEPRESSVEGRARDDDIRLCPGGQASRRQSGVEGRCMRIPRARRDLRRICRRDHRAHLCGVGAGLGKRRALALWVAAEMICDHVSLPGGRSAIVCRSRRRQRCDCGRPATLLCDWKVPTKKSGTCDKPICWRCATSPAPGKDLCPKHAAAWEASKAKGRVA